MIKQERFIDEIGVSPNPSDFLYEIAKKHGFADIFKLCSVKSRAVGIDTYHEHITDDKIIELIADNRLVALVYLRRDDWNWTEATFIEIPEAIENVKKYLKEKGLLKEEPEVQK
jgi:hypothetical protein